MAGLQVLYDCFRHEALSFFVLFSSVSSTIPVLGSGQSDYAMANAYMDYFAAKEKHANPVISIQWPSWKEAGMGEVRSKAYAQTGLLSVTNEEGLQLLDQILSSRTESVILPAVVNPEIWNPGILMQNAIQERPEGYTGSQHGGQKAVLVSPKPGGDSLLNKTQVWLAELLAEELKIPFSRLELDTAFQDYGVDSIMIAQLLRRMNQLAMLDLEPTLLFEYPTIESLAAWLVSAHPAAVSQLLGSMNMEGYEHEGKESPPQVPAASEDRRRPSNKGIHGVISSDIAVVGLSCRLPGAESLEEYWRILSEGRSAIRQVPYERWGYSSGFYAGTLNDITSFDHSFFLIPEADAQAMDPQALMVLEESLKLLSHAGYTMQEMKGKPT
ncbi:beta-ketoacyl synthase N-terminal-like domain-containing protein, partial [Paenibacillus glucanolyticus]|uniref:acyl carrier protein n=1 Tax=Paenibacillus glucanolyticus TaxID=59843 RepID=UPI003D06CCB8